MVAASGPGLEIQSIRFGAPGSISAVCLGHPLLITLSEVRESDADRQFGPVLGCVFRPEGGRNLIFPYYYLDRTCYLDQETINRKSRIGRVAQRESTTLTS